MPRFDELPDFKEARIISLQPGDKIVLRYPGQLSRSGVENLTNLAFKFFGVPVIVLEEGLDLDVLRTEEG